MKDMEKEIDSYNDDIAIVEKMKERVEEALENSRDKIKKKEEYVK